MTSAVLRPTRSGMRAADQASPGLQPVAERERIVSVDVLRGFAILGIARARNVIVAGGMSLGILTARVGFKVHEHRQLLATAAQADSVAKRGAALTKSQKDAQKRRDALRADDKPDSATLNKEIAAYRGTYAKTFVVNAAYTKEFETTVIYWGVFEFAGMMLIGMGLAKTGVLTGARSARWYLGLSAVGFAVGIPLALLRMFALESSGFTFTPRPLWWAYEPSRVMITFGWAGLLLAGCSARVLPRLTAVLSATGRMALTTYLAQNVLGALIFDGIGLGLYGKLHRAQLYLLLAVLLPLQVAFSVWWLRRFQFGPAEWVWRSLTYWGRQPLVRERGV